MPEIQHIAIFGQSYPLNVGLVSSFGYFDYTPPPSDYIPDIVERVLLLLVEQFENKDDLNDFFKILLDNGQDIENTLGQMTRMKSIAIAAADRLDIIGAIVGEPRNFRLDDEYRIAIYIRIFLNRSSGEPSALIAGINAATQALRVYYNERYPYAVVLNFTTPFEVSPNLLTLMESISMAGVLIILGMSNDTNLDGIFAPENGYPDVQNTGGLAEYGFPDANDGHFMEVWDYSGKQ